MDIDIESTIVESVNTHYETTITDVAQEILDYLRAHPGAADTLDGVVQWWLQHQRYLHGLEAVKKALDLLIERGMVVYRRGADGNVVSSVAQKPKRDGEGD